MRGWKVESSAAHAYGIYFSVLYTNGVNKTGISQCLAEESGTAEGLRCIVAETSFVCSCSCAIFACLSPLSVIMLAVCSWKCNCDVITWPLYLVCLMQAAEHTLRHILRCLLIQLNASRVPAACCLSLVCLTRLYLLMNVKASILLTMINNAKCILQNEIRDIILLPLFPCYRQQNRSIYVHVYMLFGLLFYFCWCAYASILWNGAF